MLGGSTLSLETGRLARLADGSVFARSGGTSLLATLVVDEQPHADGPPPTYLPLAVEFRDRAAAHGRIPATPSRRDGPPREREALSSRCVARALRPLFLPGFCFDTQLVVTLLSCDGSCDVDALAVTACSAAVCASPFPWLGPAAAVRVAVLNGTPHVNARPDDVENAELSLLYVGREGGHALFVDATAGSLPVPDATLAAALVAASQSLDDVFRAQRALGAAAAAAREAGGGEAFRLPPPPPASPELIRAVSESVSLDLGAALADGAWAGRIGRSAAVGRLRTRARFAAPPGTPPSCAEAAFDAACADTLAALAFESGARFDGRSLSGLRPLRATPSPLPRVHGSALFERGDTSVLATATIGSGEDAPRAGWDGAPPQRVPPPPRRLLVHYSCHPFASGSTGRSSTPGPREVGHGSLVERALSPVFPSATAFPFVARVSADTLSSAGSSSMAAVSAASLALRGAGVGTAEHVAGVSVGMLPRPAGSSDPRPFVLLTDITATEDHLGSMDWKVAGTRGGITAAQLDVKSPSVPVAALLQGLAAAAAARGEVLDAMEWAEAGCAPHDDAPCFATLPVPREAFGRIIGPQGATIKDIERTTGARLSLSDKEGLVTLFAPSAEALAAATAALQLAVGGGAKVGSTYDGRVVSVKAFGAFVLLPSGEQGLLHISEVAHARTERMEDALAPEQRVAVLVLEKDAAGKLKLSMKALLPPPEAAGNRERVAFDRRRLQPAG